MEPTIMGYIGIMQIPVRLLKLSQSTKFRCKKQTPTQQCILVPSCILSVRESSLFLAPISPNIREGSSKK